VPAAAAAAAAAGAADDNSSWEWHYPGFLEELGDLVEEAQTASSRLVRVIQKTQQQQQQQQQKGGRDSTHTAGSAVNQPQALLDEDAEDEICFACHSLVESMQFTTTYHICFELPSRFCCGNKECTNLASLSECFALIRGRACVCGGCKTARWVIMAPS
jgi:hypothetical protein